MTIYDTAHQAEHARHLFRFYQSIRELAPKQPFHRIQLRSTSGAFLWVLLKLQTLYCTGIKTSMLPMTQLRTQTPAHGPSH